MKSHLLAASIGIAALFPATGAHAWAELDFIIENPTPAYPVLLQCVANYAAPCVGGGLAYSYQQIPYNPLDGHRWSYYRLAMGSKRVMFDLYDKREGCSIGWGWERGWSWNLYATGPDLKTLGPFEICTAHNPYNSKETLKMLVRHIDWVSPMRFEIDFSRSGPWARPAVKFKFDPASGALTADIIR